MKKIYFLPMILLIAGNLQAQVYWLSNLDKAKSLAKELDKLIVVDFMADWCGPCRIMDQMLWESAEMAALSRDFVGLKINIDNDRAVAGAFGVTGIPKVVIATANGEIIWQMVGFRTATPYLDIMNAIPVEVKEINKASSALEGSKKDPKLLFELGLAFQNTGKSIDNEELKNSFLSRCENYFSKAQKATTDTNFQRKIELYTIMNDVYTDKVNKALKKIGKLDPINGSPDLMEFEHFVLAKCYQGTKDQGNFQKEKSQISNKELLAQLE